MHSRYTVESRKYPKEGSSSCDENLREVLFGPEGTCTGVMRLIVTRGWARWVRCYEFKTMYEAGTRLSIVATVSSRRRRSARKPGECFCARNHVESTMAYRSPALIYDIEYGAMGLRYLRRSASENLCSDACTRR
ncbi:hypothetical protein PHMEG_0005877 [Phytophthora megakarya]|uniref:Uncharacterized protein n=1 Tax=Phytophthora megakarya TaxID=4795 RepID=A0A225WRM7_9STRA|nr:hypothetical protein PHMEG_0005877 [Phytophthora megakarya]